MYRYFSLQEYLFLLLIGVYLIFLIKDIKKKEIGKVGIVSSILILTVTVGITFVISPSFVIGESMNPTLHNKQVLALNKLDRDFEQFDIVVLYSPELGKSLIKRVIATEGDTVSMVLGQVYVNGKLLEEPFDTIPTFEDFDEIVVPENSYFVMGDNRPNSLDSRSDEVGTIDKKYILGTIIE